MKEKSLLVQLVTTIIFVSAWDKSRDLWANSQKLTLTKSTSIVYGVKEYHKKSLLKFDNGLDLLDEEIMKEINIPQWLFEKKCPSSWLLDLDFLHIFEPLAASYQADNLTTQHIKSRGYQPKLWLFYKRITEQIAALLSVRLISVRI